MKPLVVIPARSGSKGIPGKNSKLLCGKPLIQYTLEVAASLFPKDEICITTDSNELKKIGENLGFTVPFLRPAHLASDTAGSHGVLIHALDFWESNFYKPDFIVLLQPTSPFRNEKHVKEAVSLYNQDLDMVVSVKKSESNPYYNLFEETPEGYLEKSKPLDITRRQDAPDVWEYNGAIYVINTESLRNSQIHQFKKVSKYEMDEWSSWDLDSILDWKISELYLRDNTLEAKI
jgi:N-acylneuraminate cytidylyltransferase